MAEHGAALDKKAFLTVILMLKKENQQNQQNQIKLYTINHYCPV
jgi:hypothetical protein